MQAAAAGDAMASTGSEEEELFDVSDDLDEFFWREYIEFVVAEGM